MPLSGANVSRGMGRGQAQVYDTGGNVALFGKIMAQKQAERDAEQKALASRLADLNTDGLREYDKGDYYKSYDQWRTKTQEAYNAKDKQTKFNLQAEADKLYQGLNNLVYRSKEAAKQDYDIAQRIIEKPYMFNKDGKVLFQRSISAPISSADRIQDYTKLPLGHDYSKIPAFLNSMDDQLMQTASKYDNDLGKDIVVGNKKGKVYKNIRRGDVGQQALAYATAYDTSDELKSYLQEAYPALDWSNEAQAKQQAITDFISKRPLVREEAPRYEWERAPDNYYAHYDYREGKEGAGTSVPKDISLPYDNGTANVGVKGYLPISTGVQNLGGTEVIDMKTGKRLPPLKSSNDYQIVGVGSFPVIKQGRKLAGSLAQPDFARDHPEFVEYKDFIQVQQPIPGVSGVFKDMLAPYDRFPENLKRVASVREVLKSFKSYTAPAATKAGVQKTLAGTSAQLEEAAKKKGMTKAQYKKALEAAGYTVTEK